jgi:transposase
MVWTRSPVAIDLAKQVLQLHGTDERGRLMLQRRVRRSQLLKVMAQLPPCKVVMEACGGAHHWGRELRRFGHEPRLISAQYVKAFCRRQKNDRRDAEAIACAGRQPGIPQVAVTSEEQQAVLGLHRIRERLIRDRTALTNQVHGLLGEFGIVLRRGAGRLSRELVSVLDAHRVPQLLALAQRDQLELLPRSARMNADVPDCTSADGYLVERKGIEPSTFALRTRRSPS